VIATHPRCLRIFVFATGHPTRSHIESAGVTKFILGERLRYSKAALRCATLPSVSAEASAYLLNVAYDCGPKNRRAMDAVRHVNFAQFFPSRGQAGSNPKVRVADKD